MKNYTNSEELEIGKKILLFSSAWCGDCVVLSMYIDRIVEKYEKEYEFIYIDTTIHIEITKHYDIMGIPSFVSLEDGVQTSSFISKKSKSYDQICEWIDNIYK